MNISEPLFLELAGLPASGKTTTASLLKTQLSRCGLRCIVVSEAGERSPIPHLKTDWQFNAWTLCQTVASVVEHQANKNNDIVILDKGLVDALCWIRWFRSRNKIDAVTATALESFAQVPAWFSCATVTVVLRVQFQTAFRRHGGQGRIMNAGTFTELRQAYDATIAKLLEREPGCATVIDTDQRTPDQVLAIVIDRLAGCLPQLRSLI